MNRMLRAFVAVALTALLVPELARAAEPERVVVRNRKYSSDGKFEASLNGGLTVVNFLTDHYTGGASFGYNLSEQFALELGGGYAYSKLTSVARAASDAVVQTDPNTGKKVVDDFEDLWRMQWNAHALLRWAPIYGKVNIAAELPVHFQAFLVAGGGAGGMVRDSLVYCIGNPGTARKTATCSVSGEGGANLTPLHDARVKPLFVGGAGFRVFLSQGFGLRLEARDYAFPDNFRVSINRASAEGDVAARDGGDAAAKQGTAAGSPGLTHLIFAQMGVTYTF